MLSNLLLLSGNDIPFPEAQVTIHQPTLKEIAYIGEETFFIGCGFLDFSKKLLDNKDKNDLNNFDDFDIFMSIMTSNEKTVIYSVNCAKQVLFLIFPLYEVIVRNNVIVLKQNEQEYFINKDNYFKFKEILKEMFNLNLGKKSEDEYNPVGSMAKKIAEKFLKRHEQLSKIKSSSLDNEKRISILSRYVSILSVGTQKSYQDLMQYTVYQLYDEFQRFQLKVQWDAYVQARMAGAKDLDEVDNWMIDLQDQGKEKNKTKK